MSWLLDGKPLGSVLVSRLRYLGDVVMSTVVLEVLRRGDPHIRLGFLCETAHAPAIAGHPLLDQVHRLGIQRKGSDARARIQAGAGGQNGSSTWGIIKEIRRQRYDLAVDLFFNPRSAWLLYLSGVPRRIGGARSLRRHLFTHTVWRQEMAARNPGFNELAPGGLGEHLCRLEPLVHGETGLPFAAWLAENFQPNQLRPILGEPAADSRIPDLLADLDLASGQPFRVLAPSATWPTKEWPLAHWRELIAQLLAQDSAAVLVLSPPDRDNPWAALRGDIPRGRGGVLPALDLGQVLALLAMARMLISVDGGIMHAGVGLGVPTVGLFGPTRTDAWFPYQGLGPFRVLATRPSCHPCNLHHCPEFICLPDLAPATVMATVAELPGP